MAISLEEVDRIAKLARLNFSEEEKKKFTGELSKILDYVDQLKALSEKTEISTPDEVSINLMRDDVALGSTDPKELIKLSPQSQDGFYKVKSVF